MAGRVPEFALCLVTDRRQTGERDLLWVLEEALEGGVRAVQLREKDLNGRALYHLAEKVKALCARYRARLLVNDRVDVALAIDADGVQLGVASMPVDVARELIGQEKMIGASIHSLGEAQEAERMGADFILFGPVYFTPSKASYGKPQGAARLKELVANVSLPVYAIGGIKAEQVAAVKETGARGVALISAIVSASDPRLAAQEILERLKR